VKTTVTVTEMTRYQRDITAADIRKALSLPEDADITIEVPGGGDYSGQVLNLDVANARATWLIVKQDTTEEW
jgi:hypothetical protein